MKKAFFILALAFIGFNPFLKAQSSLGIFDSTSYIPTNTYFHGSYTYFVTLKNYSLISFSGQLQVVFTVDTGNSVLTTIGTMTPTVTLAAGDTISVNTNITTDSSKFRSGINTVVIWPRATTIPFSTHDSLKTTIWVIGYSGIENYTEPKPLVFPNPVQNRVFIQNKDQKLIIERVRIWDMTGILVYDEPFKGWIDINKFASGVYMLELVGNTGRCSRYKIIKE